jgi:hypothetical protein
VEQVDLQGLLDLLDLQALQQEVLKFLLPQQVKQLLL